MPIRFRCAYCNQLLGIARRKAGKVVRCPTCAGQVIVPSPQEEDRPEEPLFERSDFAEILNPAAPEHQVNVAQSTAAGSPPAAWKTRGKPTYDIEKLDLGHGAAAPTGIVLSPTKATLLAVLVIVLLALAFVAGLLVGRSLRPDQPGHAHVSPLPCFFCTG